MIILTCTSTENRLSVLSSTTSYDGADAYSWKEHPSIVYNTLSLILWACKLTFSTIKYQVYRHACIFSTFLRCYYVPAHLFASSIFRWLHQVIMASAWIILRLRLHEGMWFRYKVVGIPCSFVQLSWIENPACRIEQPVKTLRCNQSLAPGNIFLQVSWIFIDTRCSNHPSWLLVPGIRTTLNT